ncbi:MAG: 3'-5' exonuclease [Deltaproteobacteria bacterium]|nr:3'-5' exonuclease [Deltaproteobacteria bacterium]
MRRSSCRHVAVDIETTGLFPHRGARIIEIGAVKLDSAPIVSEFHSLINCKRQIPEGVQKVHGITAEMLLEQPAPQEVFPQLLDFLGDRTIVAHNARFDIKFLRHELARLGRGLPNPSLCTMKMSKKRYPWLPNHRLETVAKHLLGELPEGLRLHRALDDARLTAMVWMEMEEND